MSKNKSYFWASYSDLMTSLFFVVLMLFTAAIVALNIEKENSDKKGTALENEIQKIREIENATKTIDPNYFEYIEKYRKHKLTIDVQFPTLSADMSRLPASTLDSLRLAGERIRDIINATVERHSKIQYLVIIEGQASKDLYKHNYELSYLRALNLKKYWESCGIFFTEEKSEVLISGSGDGTQSGTALMREEDEHLNQRFLIHILPKTGVVEAATDEYQIINQ